MHQGFSQHGSGLLEGHPRTSIPGGQSIRAGPVTSYIRNGHGITSTVYYWSRWSWGPTRVKVGEGEQPPAPDGKLGGGHPLQGACGMERAAIFVENVVGLSQSLG